MNISLFSALVFGGSLLAGFLGSLTGLGGGVVIVPLLTLAFGVDFRYAVGASLVSVIATSSGAAAAYVREGYSNIRVGLFLEIATSAGALAGAGLATRVSTSALAVIFGLVLLYSALSSTEHKPSDTHDPASRDGLGAKLRLNGEYPGSSGSVAYAVRRVPLGFSMMAVAGALSGLLGIGSGALKVLAMDRAMGLPFKVSTTTSNFMIGVTAAASAGVYLSRGYIEPGLVMPVMLGVLGGAFAGSRLLARARASSLRNLFRAVLLVLAVEMIYNGWTHRI
ncbi:MAG TPA: sulfite exporter TauE/SafE family protein [Bryobacteraceae bacterium]|nr:sulfite exporter TauE/SafE family protein [Bryobacteraceae bacterium]